VTVAEALAGLSPEDAHQCEMDLYIFGGFLVRVLPNGTQVREPMKDVLGPEGAPPSTWWRP
jgi:hypothetical protein